MKLDQIKDPKKKPEIPDEEDLNQDEPTAYDSNTDADVEEPVVS